MNGIIYVSMNKNLMRHPVMHAALHHKQMFENIIHVAL